MAEKGSPPVKTAIRPQIVSVNFVGTRGGIVKTVKVGPGCCLDKKLSPPKLK